MFSGFRSRCTSPRSCAAETAEQTPRSTCSTSEASSAAGPRETFAERAAVEQLHHEKRTAGAVDAEVVDPNDVRVREAGGGTRFVPESRRHVGHRDPLGPDHLHRNGPSSTASVAE